MPLISLVVCVHKERDLLERLLHESAGCYDDLVVVHDGSEIGDGETAIAKPPAIDFSQLTDKEPLPDGYRMPTAPARPESTQTLVARHGGRYFEGPRCFQQEPHWPFAWSRARHDWILRLDADEFPSKELKNWLREFRDQSEDTGLSGYTCVWPLWDGLRAVTRHWPRGRNFLFHRHRVRFFGMVEQVPIPETPLEELQLLLQHQPKRKSYGVRNIASRGQAFHWRRVISESLLMEPGDLPHWRWQGLDWPANWKEMQHHPLKTALRSLLLAPIRQGREMLKAEGRVSISAVAGTGLHHFLLALTFFAHLCRKKL